MYKYNIIVYKEGDYYIGKVLENNVSSFGKTEQEAYNNTIEALSLYNENEKNIEIPKISNPKFYQFNLSYA